MGLIIGLVVGGLVLVVLAVFGYMAWDYRRNQGRLRAARDAMIGMGDPDGPGGDRGCGHACEGRGDSRRVGERAGAGIGGVALGTGYEGTCPANELRTAGG